MNNFIGQGSFFAAPFAIGASLVLGILVLWSLAWKGLALWRAAHLEQRGWFIVFMLINTLGILEILYIYVWSRRSSHRPHHPNDPNPTRTEHIASETTSV